MIGVGMVSLLLVYISLVLLPLCIYTIRHGFASGVELRGICIESDMGWKACCAFARSI